MSRIYLARHGRTALNAEGALRGHLDPELDAVGIHEVCVLADALGWQALRLVVSSPLRRATATAAAVAERSGALIEVDERFIDRDYGEWAGHVPTESVAAYGSLDSAPGVEPAPVVLGRALEGLEDVASRLEDGSGLIVSHDVVNRLVLHHLDPSLGDPEHISQDTACFNVLERTARQWVVVSVNNPPAGHERGPSGAPDGGVPVEGTNHG